MKTSKIVALLAFTLTTIFTSAQISFTADVTSGCAPLTVNFTNTSTDPNAVTYQWNFGDGTPWQSGTDQTHTFTNGGSFTVWLQAYDATSGYLGDHYVNIDVQGQPSGFNVNTDSICPGDVANFQVYSSGSTFEWDFGDGTTHTEYSSYNGASHTYNTPGTYTVTVDVTTSCGVFTVDTSIVVAHGLAFENQPYHVVHADTSCPGGIVSMYTDNSYSSYYWDFNDGNSSTDWDTQHAFTNAGWNYINLTVTNGCGSNIVLTDSVFVGNSVPVYNPYIWEVDSVCPGEEFNIQATSNNGVNYSWDFNDGNPPVIGSNINYSIANAGTYNVNLTITNDCGVDSIIPTTIVVTPNAPLNNVSFWVSNHYICPGDNVEFGNNGHYHSYYFDFGDGTGSSNVWNHTYNNVGDYVVSATIQNACGNSVTLYDTIHVQNNLPFTGNINASMNMGQSCINSVTSFYASSGYAGYLWDFGDGSTSTNREAEHIYNSPGNYNVSVTVTNGCGATAVQNVTAQIVDNMPIQQLDYEILGDSICPGDNIFFTSDDNEGINYTWDMGDGTVVNDFDFTHSYSTTGTYYVTITGTNGCGNDTTLTDSVIVDNNTFPSPNNMQIFTQQEGCIGDDLYFVAGPGGAGTYLWEFGDGNSTTQTDPVNTPEGIVFDVAQHSYLNTGVYDVYFTVTNGCGNSYHDTLQVEVGTVGDTVDIDVSFWWDEEVASCQGQPIEFAAVGASTYAWDFGDGSGTLITQGSLTPVYHTFTNPGTYNIVVTGLNNCGISDSRNEEIFIPQSLITLSTNTVQDADCGSDNGMAVVSATGGLPPYSYSWSNGDNSVIADSLTSGLYIITVTDNNDCSSEGIVTVSDNQGPTILLDNIVNVDCYGQDNGSISVTILGGVAPYSILWSNGDQTEDIFNLVAGPYEIFVTDANGCQAMQSFTVEQPTEAVVSVITQDVDCGGGNGGAMAVISNGAAPYNFIWPNQTGPSNQTGGLTAGIYNLMVIDANTCLHQKEFVINESTAPIILTDSIVTGTCSGSLSGIYINTIGGQGPFTYTWSDGSSNQDLTGVLPGSYSVEIEGANGCSSFMPFEVEMTTPDENPICIVTVDTNTNTNVVVWTPVQTTDIDYYNIYKESSQSGLYYLIGTRDADSLSFYEDVLSDPTIRSWRYKIAAVDDCGNEGDLSDEHKTIHLTANLGVGGVVNLIWDNYEGFSYGSFHINRYHPTTGWQQITTLPSNLNSFTDQTPPDDSLLVYTVEVDAPSLCSAVKAQDHNSTRSNRATIGAPQDTTGSGGGDNSIEELLLQNASVIPNPNNGIFTIMVNADNWSYQLFDMTGKQIARKQGVVTGTETVDMTEVETGIYLLKIEMNEHAVYRRVIKQ